jgi:hypothetical protein
VSGQPRVDKEKKKKQAVFPIVVIASSTFALLAIITMGTANVGLPPVQKFSSHNAIQSPGVDFFKRRLFWNFKPCILGSRDWFFFLTNYRQNSIFLKGRLPLQKEKKGLII